MSTSGSLLADDAERAAFRTVISKVFADGASSERVRAVVDAGGVPDARLAMEAAKMGWFGVEIPEESCGAGAGLVELALLLEEAGAHVASVPLVSSAVLCAGTLLLSGSNSQRERFLPGLAEGHTRGTALLSDAFNPAHCVLDQVRAVPSGSMLRLHGSCGHVLDARISDLILVDAREVIPDDGDGRTRRVVGLVRRGDPGVRVEPLAMTDATRCLDAVQFDDVALAERDVVARGKDADTLLTALVNRASVAVAADSVGIARRVVNMTASYANQRKQFGRLIGSFQAVKHQAADMLVDTETSDGLVDDAVRKVGEDPTSPESTLAASMAKSHACEKAAHSVGVALQLHGGIGYTWEHDLHLFLKRATLNEQLFGSTRWHRDRVATHILTSRST